MRLIAFAVRCLRGDARQRDRRDRGHHAAVGRGMKAEHHADRKSRERQHAGLRARFAESPSRSAGSGSPAILSSARSWSLSTASSSALRGCGLAAAGNQHDARFLVLRVERPRDDVGVGHDVAPVGHGEPGAGELDVRAAHLEEGADHRRSDGLTCSMVCVSSAARVPRSAREARARERERGACEQARRVRRAAVSAGAGLIGSHFTCLPLNLAPASCRGRTAVLT